MPDATVNYRLPPSGGIVPTPEQIRGVNLVIADVTFIAGAGPARVFHGMDISADGADGLPIVSLTLFAPLSVPMSGYYTVADEGSINVGCTDFPDRVTVAVFRVTIEKPRRGLW
jgi:hypothetical protein